MINKYYEYYKYYKYYKWNRQLIFENLRVPASNLLGQKGHGFKMAMAGLDGGRLNIGIIIMIYFFFINFI